MKFSTAILSLGLIAVASAASSTSVPVPTQTSSYTKAQDKCLAACDDADLVCKAGCLGAPAPDPSMVNATTKCAMKCVQGDGSESDTAAYAACQQKCIKDNYFTSGSDTATTASDSSETSSPSDSTESSGSTATSGGSKSSPTSKSSGSSTTGSSGGSNSSNNNSTGSSTSSSPSASESGSGAGKITVSGAAVFGILIAAFAL